FQGGPAFSSAQEFWSAQPNLMKYDIVILSCEGITAPQTKPPVALEAMKQYANAGGRVFASHWHRFWFDTSARNGNNGEPAGPQPSPFEAMATWRDRGNPPNPSYGSINTTFPKG